ncbi:O-antigen ligase family protein [Psychrobacillus sp. FSL H8-0484]|uniref:O-antigen ligase family protein n=1 Tax=Psychrobacillus sp. FSL H8-0484 TaxID=2921390 RepID=UPI0030F6956B
MSQIKKHITKKDLVTFLAACLFLIISMFLPSNLTIIITSIFFVAFAYIKPFQSLLFLVPYVSIRPILLEINPGLKLAGDIITFAVFAKLLVSSKLNLKSLLTFKWFEWLFFAFLFFGSIIGLLNDVSIASVIFQLRTFLIMYMLYYILSRTILPASWLERLAWVTLLTSWLVSIHGLVEKLSMRQWLLPDVWKYKTLSATNIVRIYGLPGNPNSLALLLMFGIVAVLFLSYLYKDKSYKVFLNVSLVMFIGIFILTYSRGTFISAAVLGAVFIFLAKDWKLIKRLVIAGIASIILVYYPVNLGVSLFQSFGLQSPERGPTGSIGGRFEETFNEDNLALMTQSGRIFYLKKGFEVFSDYPLTGSGFGTFGGAATLSYGSPIYDNYGIRSDIYGGKNFYSDNQYIQVIAETGVIGVLLFAGFLVGMLLLFWKERHTTFGKFMIALWFSTGFSGFYYNIWELKAYTIFFFIILGSFAAMNKWYPTIHFKDK